jgi:hypothetical protein
MWAGGEFNSLRLALRENTD